ncbi:MAG: VWA domain-containing protein [Chloroflexi bacterium]|nr:VWA domain-containing protein [Chloroflexota bacterium]
MPTTHPPHSTAPTRPATGPRSAWPALLAALALSLPLHLLLALWLASVRVERPERAQQAVLVETVAPSPGEDMVADAVPAAPLPMPSVPMTGEPGAAIQAAPPGLPTTDPGAWSAQGAIDPAPPALVPGAASLQQGSGGVATTSFFGARATGRRFAFIVDKSGSMQSQGKMRQAIEELLRSVRALPDFAQFRVCFFDTSNTLFPERGFRKARAADLQQLGAWIERVRPFGGTTPAHAFEQVMSDAMPPDAIFFMTDGLIPQEDPDAIIRLASVSGALVPVHCVAFGDAEAARQLQAIARATGGQYRFVPLEGVP